MTIQQWRATRRDVLTLAVAAGAAVGATALVDQGQPATASSSGDPLYDVKLDFGARGDGSTDDTAAIQAALDAARAGGGGVVYLPPGTYMVAVASRIGGPGPSFPTATALMYGPRTTVLGAGRDATTIKLLGNQPGTIGLANPNVAILAPWDVGQEQVSFAGFTLDGNAANQSDYHNGIITYRQRGVKMHGVRVRDCRGAETPVAANTVFFYANSGADHTFVDCEALQTGTNEASCGFSCVSMTNVQYVACAAVDIGHASSDAGGFGYVVFQSRQVSYAACHAYGIGQEGFHVDDPTCTNIVYTGCIAGGIASVQSPQYPFTSGQSLGCKYGFVCTVAAGAIQYVGCAAESNAINGFELRAGTFLLSGCSSRNNGGNGFSFSLRPTVRMQGGDAEGNHVGIFIATAADAAGIRITGGPHLTGNAAAAVEVPAGVVIAAPPTNVAAPAMPSSGSAMTNLFGFDATICVAGGSVTAIAVGGVVTGLTSGSFRVPAGQSIRLTYSSPPTWTWFLD